MINIAHPRVEKKPPINKLIRSNHVFRSRISKSTSNRLNKNHENKECLDCFQDSSNSNASKQNIRYERNDKSVDSTSDCNQNIIENNVSYPFEQLSDMIVYMEKNYNQQQQDETLTINRSFIPIEEIAIISPRSEYADHQVPAEIVKSDDLNDKTESPATCHNSSAYNDIMHFLGTLEEPDCHQSSQLWCERQLSQNDRDDTSKIITPDMDRTIMKEELATVLLKLDDREGTIKILKEELKNERKISCKKLEDEKKYFQDKLIGEKTKYENAIKRHQRFIEKLIGEKKKLTEKCNCLAEKIQEMEDKFQKDLKSSMEKQVVELQRTRDMCIASEKMRRERWLEAKTSKIKEMTVKGLEPELRTMIEKHQEEIQQMKSIHMKELQEIELRTIRRSNQQLEELRLELTQTHDTLMSNEREALRLRYQEKFNEQETLMQMQQRKFFQDLQNEKLRFSDELEQKQLESEAAVHRVSAEFQEKMDNLIKEHEIEKHNLKETLITEHTMWADNFKRQQIIKYEMAEVKIRNECDRERDRQIELAIERLEKETRDMKINIEKKTENKLRCMKEKYDTEMQIMQENEKLAKEKFTVTQQKLEQLQDEFKKLQEKLTQCLADCHSSHERLEQLEREKEDAKKLARQEIEHEKSDLHNKIASLYDEIAKINKNKELHMTQLYSRVKLCITRRDVIINRMTIEANEARNRCDYLEKMLDQQRKEYVLRTL